MVNRFQNIDAAVYDIYIREADNNLERIRPTGHENGFDQTLYGKYIYTDGFFIDHNMRDTTFLTTPSYVITNNYWLSHLPTALGLSLGLMIGLEPIYLFIMGRLIQLLVFCLGAYYAVNKMPVGKECLMAILLLPITLLQASTYSEDPLLIAAGAVIISLSLKWTLIKDNNKKKMICEGMIYFISCFFIVMIKYGIYIPLCFLPVILMNRKQITNGILKYKKVIIPITILVIIIIIAVFSNKFDVIYQIMNGNQLARGGLGYSLGYIISHPIEIVPLAANTIFSQSRIWLGMLFSSFFTQGYIVMPNWLAVGFFILVIWGMLITREHNILTNLQKKKLLAIFIMMCLFLSACFLFSYTRLSQAYIFGMQGRYFLPGLALLIIALPLKNLKLITVNKYKWLGFFAFWHQIFIYSFLINIK